MKSFSRRFHWSTPEEALPDSITNAEYPIQSAYQISSASRRISTTNPSKDHSIWTVSISLVAKNKHVQSDIRKRRTTNAFAYMRMKTHALATVHSVTNRARHCRYEFGGSSRLETCPGGGGLAGASRSALRWSGVNPGILIGPVVG
jgi:hypothetical protein